MHILITGMNGTVAPALAAHLREASHTVTAWDRSAVPIDSPDAVRSFIIDTSTDWFFHLAMGSPDWSEMIARVCAERQIKLLYTSSVSVFANSQTGPHTVDTVPEPDDDYGRYKLECERRVHAANPSAIVARLGWQIGTAPGSNNMVDYFERTQREQSRIEASCNWVPACSFLQDTAEALTGLIQQDNTGLYHVDGNPGLSICEIAQRLNEQHGHRWNVVPTEQPSWNTRMLDPRVKTASIANRL